MIFRVSKNGMFAAGLMAVVPGSLSAISCLSHNRDYDRVFHTSDRCNGYDEEENSRFLSERRENIKGRPFRDGLFHCQPLMA